MEDIQGQHCEGDHYAIEHKEEPLRCINLAIPPIHEFDYSVNSSNEDED
jgi:hypothetical protein